MTSIRLILLLQILLIAAGCQQAAETTAFNTAKPKSLLRIDNSILSVTMTIDGSLQYEGRLQPDGTWVVRPQGLTLDADHTVVNEWFGQYEGQKYLLVRQQGSFYADPVTLQAVLDLPDVSSGSPEFDVDCDNISNLDEFTAGSDPGSSPGCQSETDPVPVTDTGTTLRAWAVHDFSPFVLSGYILPVQSFEQPINVQAFDAGRGLSFGVSVYTDLAAETTDRLSINLSRDKNGNKVAEVSIAPAIGSQLAAGGSCYDSEVDESWLACSIPFDWQLDHWYTLRMTKSALNSPTETSRWDGWVVDQVTGEEFALGTIEAAENITLQRPSVGIGYFFTHTQTECTEGLPQSTIHYRPMTVDDNAFEVLPAELQAGPCAVNGGGWSSDDSMIDEAGNVVYSLTLGR